MSGSFISHILRRSRPNSDPILTLREVAVLLKVAEKTVCTVVRGGQIPALKVWGQRQFTHYDIDQWIDEQKVCLKENPAEGASDV